jgi:hypothetical protein
MTQLQNTKGNALAFIALSFLFLTSYVQPVFAERPSLTSLMQKIAELQTRVEALEAELAVVQSNSVLELDGLLTLDYSSGYATALFNEVNVQLVNGINTYSSNGLGNLILGYNDAGLVYGRPEVCSEGQYQSMADCLGAGEVWARDHKSGSHYLVIGDFNNYSKSAGVVVGDNNTSNGVGSVVLGGGGIATANRASGHFSVIVGGQNNQTTNRDTVIVGGYGNRASGHGASVSGGHSNEATGRYASVSGGMENKAIDEAATVSGGKGRTATGAYDWVAGSLFEDM